MPTTIAAAVTALLAVGAIAAIGGSSAQHKCHLAAHVFLCAAGILAASIVASLVLFQSTWPDGPEEVHWLVLTKCAGLGVLVLVPFLGLALLVELHRRSKD